MKIYNYYKKVIEDLEKQNINICKLITACEVKNQLQEDLYTEEEQEKIFNTAYQVYLKADCDLSIERIVTATIESIETIDNISLYDIIERAYWIQ